ncbi:MAG TPA: HEAT repeat domain-containing protein [Planctomycetota bacterium]|nr:HEAT repeat domain-containing protein [Planctomycetota bacterium]
MDKFCYLLALASLAGCAQIPSPEGPSDPDQPAVAAPASTAVPSLSSTSGDRHALPDQTRCELIEKLESATRDPDAKVRHGAAYVLGRRGPASSLDAIGQLVSDPDPLVRLQAIGLVGTIGTMNPGLERAATSYLMTGVRDSWPNNSNNALQQLAHCSALNASELDLVRGWLRDGAPHVQICAARILEHAGAVDGLEQGVVDLIESNYQNSWDRQLALLLGCIHDEKNLWAVKRLLGSMNPSVRFTAKCAAGRLDASAVEWKEQAQIESDYNEQNLQALESLRAMPWQAGPEDSGAVEGDPESRTGDRARDGPEHS